ncbi:MAG: hypothetical protein JNK55_03810, partial [Rubrivivax sp.]|nr:hypothetical protein [Rubrivivax sp.]
MKVPAFSAGAWPAGTPPAQKEKPARRRVFGVGGRHSAMARAIHAAIVIVVMLAVVFLAVDTVALHVLRVMDARP